MTPSTLCQVSELLCREGSCPHRTVTIIETEVKGRILKYYLCRKHWDELCHIWMESKGITIEKEPLLSPTKLVNVRRSITEVCLDDQHQSCKNDECECRCHQ
jgi:hypothetical protein